MDFYVAHRVPAEGDDPVLVLFLFEGDGPLPRAASAVDEAVGGLVSRVRVSGEFPAKARDTLILHSAAKKGPRRVLRSFRRGPKEADIQNPECARPGSSPRPPPTARSL